MIESNEVRVVTRAEMKSAWIEHRIRRTGKSNASAERQFAAEYDRHIADAQERAMTLNVCVIDEERA